MRRSVTTVIVLCLCFLCSPVQGKRAVILLYKDSGFSGNWGGICKYGEFNNETARCELRRYLFVKANVVWNAASSSCKNRGGYLVVYQNGDEEENVESLFEIPYKPHTS